MKRIPRALEAFCTTLIAIPLGGCGDDDSSRTLGSAPLIADLSLAPTELKVGSQTNITGTLSFQDPDGDVFEIGMEVRLPTGQSQAIPQSAVSGVSAQTSGVLNFMLSLMPRATGDYVLDVWIIDRAGQPSNRLTGTFKGL